MAMTEINYALVAPPVVISTPFHVQARTTRKWMGCSKAIISVVCTVQDLLEMRLDRIRDSLKVPFPKQTSSVFVIIRPGTVPPVAQCR